MTSRAIAVSLALASVLGFSAELAAQPRLTLSPNEAVPRELTLENEHLLVRVQIGRYVYLTSLLDKVRGVQFVDPEQPPPLVKVGNQWHLLQVGFNVWQVTELVDGADRGAEIRLFSNSLENPYHLVIRLWMSGAPELRLHLSLEHRADEERHDMPYVSRRTATVGLSLLRHLRPPGASDPSVIFKKGLTHFHRDTEGVGMYFLRQADGPGFPQVVSWPGIGGGVLLHREASDLDWSFDSAEDALSFMRPAPLDPGETFLIFEGVLRPFGGDWRAAFSWWRDRLRSELDLSHYQRPGHAEYRKKVVGHFTMAFDHEFYDPVENRYRLQDLLARGEREFGGYDSLLFWHGYPRLGVDPRDEWAMYQGLPGGLEGLRALVTEANRQGVWVFLSFNPWDVIGHRDDLGAAQAEVMARTGANGTYLDIMSGATERLRQTFDRVDPGIVFSSENRPSFAGLALSTGSQEDHEYVTEMPRLDLLRFVLPEHNISNTERMGRNRTNQIRNTIFNLVGFTVWEDIFGEINRYSWDERVLITRYNRLVHDHMDAFLTLEPRPLLPTRPLGRSQGSSPHKSAWSPNPETHDHPYPPPSDDRPSGLCVNAFPTSGKTLYSLYHHGHDNVDRFHDNRARGRLFRVEVPADWRVVNVWDGLPAEIIEWEGERWVSVRSELPDPSAVFVAMPRQITIREEAGSWRATVPGPGEGTLRLAGMDTERRPLYGESVPASGGLRIGPGDVPANVDGYVMVQYLREGDVTDVAVVRTSR